MTLPSHPFRFTYGPRDDRLHDFYLPALERSVLYRRSAGYFSSSALAIAAAGIARLIANGGSMQLLCGADLASEDVEAILRGESLRSSVEKAMLRRFDQDESEAGPDMVARLETLAWLVAHDRLEIRVVLPKGPDGQPIPRPDSQEYYHPKEGVFVDAEGNKLAFSGSSNESRSGWQSNYETFHVFASWPRQTGPHSTPPADHYITPIERRFQALWKPGDPGWIALPLPEAVRRRLLDYAPTKPPTKDPLERPRSRHELGTLRFLRDAPFMPQAARIGIETSAVSPWPHQDRVIDAVVDRFPRSFLFCDEVGLGKTIEAGLALRQLIVTKRVRRSLILAPASVVRQWQEELWEKCALNIPRYERGALVDVHGEERQINGPPWGRADRLIASSQLAKRTDRRDEVLEPEWDLVLVDEAHHARRKEFGIRARRPNHLLQLLGGHGKRPGLKDRTRCLYLLTATPMQVHPIEVWDLLKLLGLEGRWGANEENFLTFFEEVRNPYKQRDWPFLLGMWKDFVKTGGQIDPAFEERARNQLGPVTWNTVKTLPDTIKSRATIEALGAEARAVLSDMIRHHTPIRTFVWRNGRDLLHRYRQRGILSERVPKRKPRNEWIEFTPEEQELYDRIEEYISHFYRKYEARRRGLGFVMTVYRRRLTSSFHAARKSLGRRRAFLVGDADAVANTGLTEEDLEQDDLGMDAVEDLGTLDRQARETELAYLDDFISDLNALATDSKLEFLKDQLTTIFRTRDSAILFTQYTDTMDYLRESLRSVYGSGVACYSGRGGESWDGEGWVLRDKEEIKEAFRRGDSIRLLICTESASEGLNLQTCGVLINYDMPWNPMRVEQRIGRIDRIGQRHDEVHVHNYFFRDTVEAIVYARLSDRIDWFEHVVGTLQPILHNVGRAITKLAMMGRQERERDFDDTLSEIEHQADAHDQAGIDLDALVDESIGSSTAPESPVRVEHIKRAFLASDVTRQRFLPHATIPDAYWLHSGDTPRAVTFSPRVFDSHPTSVELLTYGNPTFDILLDEVVGPRDQPAGTVDSEEAGAAMLLRDSGRPPVAVCVAKEKGQIDEVATISAYERAAREHEAGWSDTDRVRAREVLADARSRLDGAIATVEEEMAGAKRRGLREEARRILFESAHILAVQEGFFTPADDDAVERLCQRGVPYRGLRSIVGGEVPRVSSDDAYRAELDGKSPGALQQMLNRLRDQGVEVLRRYAGMG